MCIYAHKNLSRKHTQAPPHASSHTSTVWACVNMPVLYTGYQLAHRHYTHTHIYTYTCTLVCVYIYTKICLWTHTQAPHHISSNTCTGKHPLYKRHVRLHVHTQARTITRTLTNRSRHKQFDFLHTFSRPAFLCFLSNISTSHEITQTPQVFLFSRLKYIIIYTSSLPSSHLPSSPLCPPISDTHA